MDEMKVYDEDTVRGAALEYFHGNTLAADVWVNKYALRDQEDNFYELTPTDMHHRMAREFHRIEMKYPDPLSYDEIFDMFKDFRYILPQGSPMYGIGNPFVRSSLSNCLVVASPEDSVSGIVDTGKQLANLMKMRAGVGVDISTLRPDGLPVNNSAKTTSGAWSFADYYSYVTNMIGQNNRRGALMITMDIRHPDAEKFAKMKLDKTKVVGANVSLRGHDDFMQAVIDGTTFRQQWPVDSDEPTIVKDVDARALFKDIYESAWECADPGLIFWDTAVSTLPAHCYPDFKTICTNPCGEILLSANDACRLIAINLASFVENPFTDQAYFNFLKFSEVIYRAMRLMDDLVDLEIERLNAIIESVDRPEEIELWTKVRESCEQGRRTGLGTTGLGDMLAKMCLKYDTEEAIEIAEIVYRNLRFSAYYTSKILAEQRGTFPAYDPNLEKGHPFIQEIYDMVGLKNDQLDFPRRNISILTNAPTGSVSMVALVDENCPDDGFGYPLFGTSSGIEPVFKNSYVRRRKLNQDELDIEPDSIDEETGQRWKHYDVYHPNVQSYMKRTGNTELPDYFVEADQIDWKKRVEMQAVIQSHIDHSVSSTINLPKDIEPEVIGEIYKYAWQNGLKGITVYREGSKGGVLISKEEPQDQVTLGLVSLLREAGALMVDDEISEDEVIQDGVRLPTVVTSGPRHTVEREGNKYYMQLDYLTNDKHQKYPIAFWCVTNEFAKKEYVSLRRAQTSLIEMMAEKGVSRQLLDRHLQKLKGSEIRNTDNHADKLAKTISMAMRHNVKLIDIVDAITGVEGDYISSTLTSIRKFLTKHFEEGQVVGQSCPQCHDELVYQEGCVTCLSCGFSKCG